MSDKDTTTNTPKHRGKPQNVLSDYGVDIIKADYNKLTNQEFQEKYNCSRSGMRSYILPYLNDETPKETIYIDSNIEIADKSLHFDKSLKGRKNIACSNETYARLQIAADELVDETLYLKKYCVDYIIRKGLEAIGAKSYDEIMPILETKKEMNKKDDE